MSMQCVPVIPVGKLQIAHHISEMENDVRKAQAWT